ncbi:MAG TPA: GNAT family protein [Ferrovibrio sp.]|uniref:GNAT family N-acetyltransferase n=1 Tax=Ferrovibrio sp. TaxID=1917215 RepID=UPI002B4B421A|nr:GNAT family protein [Ferrovibrio sp.]HLT78854.1 GNAT family protein [Ferrovibrio sp.]
MLFGRFLPGAVGMLSGERVDLRAPGIADFEAWATLRAVSRDHLQPWEPRWADDALTRDGYRRRLAWFDRLRRQDLGEAWFIHLRRSNTLLGGITLSNLRRGASQCGELGYWIGLPHTGKGYMTEALALVVAHSFGPLKLHRLEAACVPENEASQRVLRRAGFRPEGVLREYLKIDGVWRDHRLYARLASDPPP